MNVSVVMNTNQESSLNDIILTFACLLLCLAAGYAMQWLVGGLPASLFGMIFFTTTLHFKWLDAKRVERTISWCIRHMAVCFVPAGVGIIEHQQLVINYGISIVCITFVTTFIILAFVGKCYQASQNFDKASEQR